jgi:cell shape-determining protein MreC
LEGEIGSRRNAAVSTTSGLNVRRSEGEEGEEVEEGEQSMPDFVKILAQERRIRKQKREIEQMREEVEKLRDQNERMREAMRRCLSCEYRQEREAAGSSAG